MVRSRHLSFRNQQHQTLEKAIKNCNITACVLKPHMKAAAEHTQLAVQLVDAKERL